MMVMKFQLKMKPDDLRALEQKAGGVPSQVSSLMQESEEVEIVIRRKRKDSFHVKGPTDL